MPALILHHYPLSPFAEKIRRVLAFKQLAWTSVTIPMVMPKPDLTALTGGYRKPPVLQQMVYAYEFYHCAVLGVQEVPREDTKSYGIVAARPLAERVEQISAIVEKPKPEDAPSNLAVVGRYVLTPRIFDLLEQVKPGAGGEIVGLWSRNCWRATLLGSSNWYLETKRR